MEAHAGVLVDHQHPPETRYSSRVSPREGGSSTRLRDPFVLESAEHKPVQPEGSGLRYAIGELLTCTRCVGTWSALTLVGLRTASPPAGRAVSTVLALAGANNVLRSGVRLLAERANQAHAETAKQA